jgi:hypothetical protein
MNNEDIISQCLGRVAGTSRACVQRPQLPDICLGNGTRRQASLLPSDAVVLPVGSAGHQHISISGRGLRWVPCFRPSLPPSMCCQEWGTQLHACTPTKQQRRRTCQSTKRRGPPSMHTLAETSTRAGAGCWCLDAPQACFRPCNGLPGHRQQCRCTGASIVRRVQPHARARKTHDIPAADSRRSIAVTLLRRRRFSSFCDSASASCRGA